MTDDEDPPGDKGGAPPREPAPTSPPPRRKRRPPPALEGFDTGIPSEELEASDASAPTDPVPPTPQVMPAFQPAAEDLVTPTPQVMPAFQPATGEPPPSAADVMSTSPEVHAPASDGAPLDLATADLAPADLAPADAESAPADAAASASDVAASDAPASPSDVAPSPIDDPAQPLGYAATDLSEAVGAPTRRRRAPTDVDSTDDEDLEDPSGRPRRRKLVMVWVLSLIVGLGFAALVFLGRANSAWYYISCEPERVVAEQGRSFPPWGESTLEGTQWAPIKIPPEAECSALETESFDELTDAFRKILVDRATVLLTASEVTKIEEAATMLDQALLHARSDSETHRKARPEIQRLLGDVVYWRASAKLRDAAAALQDAAKQFDAAAAQRPRHVTDASAWAAFVRRVASDLRAGPSGTTQTSFPPLPPEPRPIAPPGVALPVEPDHGSAGSAAELPPAPPDAGIPTGGGVLL